MFTRVDYRKIAFAGMFVLGLVGSFYYPRIAHGEERAFHRICEGKASTDCISSDQFIQRRDDCNGKDEGLCFGVGRTSDGWVTDLVRKGRCYQSDDRPKGVPCDPMPFRYGVIEYKTNGLDTAHHWQDSQLRQITREIASEKDVFLVVFIHGWHHDSREKIGVEYSENDLRKLQDANISQDRNLLFFKHILAKTRWELDQAGQRNQKVLGVYVGWDGGPPNAKLNAGDRASAANRIGLSIDFGNDLKLLSRAVKSANPTNKMLVIGHSFGGRILSRFMLKNASQGNADPLGHGSVAVTLNPAISADSFDDYMKLKSVRGLPAWINITSRDDWATGMLFELASTPLSRLLPSGHDINDTIFSPATGRSIGHYAPYQNFQLSICYEGDGNSCAAEAKFASCQAPTRQQFRSATDWYLLPSDGGNACHYLCSAFGDSNKKCDSRQYLISLIRHDQERPAYHAISGKMWNIVTDLKVIGPDQDYKNQSAIAHNAFDQTNLVRMLVELTLAR